MMGLIRNMLSARQQEHEIEAYAHGNASTPMSVYGPDMWTMCFPNLFPYGDGVFGLSRKTLLTFQQWMGMHLLREELSYGVTPEICVECSTPLLAFACYCERCGDSTCAFAPHSQPRWRRMEQSREAKGYVMRTRFKERFEKICGASWQNIDAAIVSLGSDVSIKDVPMYAELMYVEVDLVNTTDICSFDGAWVCVRYEQNGYTVMFGGVGVFLTPNIVDTRPLLMLVMHNAGKDEQNPIRLLQEEPTMPCVREMLPIITKDPVSQARCFIIAIRLFCEHVLGTGPLAFSDGFAALHGPIEEQARGPVHAHILVWSTHFSD